MLLKNRKEDSVIKLPFIPPMIVDNTAQDALLQAEIDSEAALWQYSLVGMAAGFQPSHQQMTKFVTE